jgi:hypothetical protein
MDSVRDLFDAMKRFSTLFTRRPCERECAQRTPVEKCDIRENDLLRSSWNNSDEIVKGDSYLTDDQFPDISFEQVGKNVKLSGKTSTTVRREYRLSAP